MRRIGLRFEVFEHRLVSYRDAPLPVARLRVGFRPQVATGDLSEAYEAVLDTGAYVTVIPRYIWRGAETQVWSGDVYFGGVNRAKRCQIRADLGEVYCVLSDAEGNRSPALTIPAYLAHTDRAPLLIGFADLLTRYRTTFDPTTGEAWIEPGKGIG